MNPKCGKILLRVVTYHFPPLLTVNLGLANDCNDNKRNSIWWLPKFPFKLSHRSQLFQAEASPYYGVYFYVTDDLRQVPLCMFQPDHNCGTWTRFVSGQVAHRTWTYVNCIFKMIYVCRLTRECNFWIELPVPLGNHH